MNNIYAALEIGTSRTVLAVGEAETGQRLKITCHAHIPSTGVRKSEILDIAQASHSIRSVLREVEKRQLEQGSSLTIGNAFLLVSGQHVKVDSYQATAQIARGKVSEDDMEQVSRAARSMPLPDDREVLDIAEQLYSVDDADGLLSPRNRSGRILKLRALYVHADSNRINDAKSAAGDQHLELRDPVFACTCAADAVLSESERREGVMVLDVGGGCTGYAVYCDGVLAIAGVIGVGGDHITNDIAIAFQTTQAQAEEMKIKEANALIQADSAEPARIRLPGSSPLMEQRTISRNSLNTVVNARCRELFAILRSKLAKADLLNRLGAGIVLTGGGAALRGFAELLRRELGEDVRMGAPIYVDGLENEQHPESCAAIAGALMYAHRNYEEKSFFKMLFGGGRK